MPVNVLTQRNGVDRRGINRQETKLHPGNVNFAEFGKIGGYPVKGSVYAQPLYVSQVECEADVVKNLVVIVTMANAVYAYDANAEGSGAKVWSIEAGEVGESVDSSKFDDRGYDDFYKKPIGILSTPVIDVIGEGPVKGVIYLVSYQFDALAFTANGDTPTPAMFSHVLLALDLGTGKILRRQKISGRYPGGGYLKSPEFENLGLRTRLNVDQSAGIASMNIRFDGKDVLVVDAEGLNTPTPAVLFNSMMQLQRPALLLQGGVLTIAFGSHRDDDPYHGWVFAYEAASFKRIGVLCTTPNGVRGGIWQAGQGLVLDSNNNIYASTGNGDNDKPGKGQLRVGSNLGESFLKFQCDANGVRLKGWFCFFKDFNNKVPSESADAPDDDFGAAAPALLPDERIVAGGKDGWFYLIDPDQLDKLGRRPNEPGAPEKEAVPQAFKASFNIDRGSRIGMPTPRQTTRHIHGSPVVWDTRSGPVYVYVWGENDVVRAYQYAPETGQDPRSGRFLDQPPNFKLDQPPAQGIDFARGDIYASNEEPQRDGMPGGFLALSQNGSVTESAILWAAYPQLKNANTANVDGALIAYDASAFDLNLGYKRLTMLWNSRQTPSDGLGAFAKFCCPTIADGRVYQATGDGQIVIYGLRPNRIAPRIGFDGGGGGFVLNGSARLSDAGTIVLTEHAKGEANNPNGTTPTFLAGSVFTRRRFDIRTFETSFTFRLTAAGADGFTFTIQAEGPHAIGSSGSGLGYMIDPHAPFAANMQPTILHSFAVKFLLRDENGAPVSRLGLLANGVQLPGFVDIDLQATVPGPIDLRSGDPIVVRLRYDGTRLFAQLTNANTGTRTQDFALIAGDIATTINSVQGLAHLGFTGGTGILSVEQEIIDWDFQLLVAEGEVVGQSKDQV